MRHYDNIGLTTVLTEVICPPKVSLVIYPRDFIMTWIKGLTLKGQLIAQ